MKNIATVTYTFKIRKTFSWKYCSMVTMFNRPATTDLMQLTSIPYVTKRETDTGPKAGCYNTILSAKKTVVYGV